MQVFKRIISHCETWSFAAHHPICITKQSPRTVTKNSQNLLEFIFVLPILIFISLAILEVALYWQDVNAIYNLNAEINANVALLPYRDMSMGSVCPAVDASTNSSGEYFYKNSALAILKKRAKMITMTDTNFNVATDDGKNQPFVLYKVTGGPLITATNGEQASQVTLWVDCRNPFEDGVTTQLEFYHKTVVMKASIPRFDKPTPIVIIPDKIFIASPKLNTLHHY
jgi:hypothetical protein